MSKLIVSEIESTGTSVQINDDLKVGSTGTNVITSGNVVAPSEDMIKNFKAFENPIIVYDAAVSSTGVPGFTNAVPHVTSTSTGLTTGTALAATSTGNSLLTNFSADAVYVYNSSGTANCKNDYWGATIDIPKAFRGQNIVLSFDYRTEAASTNVTGEDQWFVAVQDKTNTVAFLVTATALVSAGSAVGVVSSTGLAVGDKVWLEGGGNAQGSVSNSITEAYITEVTDSTNIKLSQDYTPASTANSIGQTGFLTNTLQFLAAADSDTDKVGKNRKLSFKTADNTSQVNVFFQLRNTSSTVVHSLYFDNVYISSNKFLQASSQTQAEQGLWYGRGGTNGFGSTYNGVLLPSDEGYNTISQYGTVELSATDGFSFTANQRCRINMTVSVQGATAAIWVGISKNATGTALTTGIEAIPPTQRVALNYQYAVTGSAQASFSGIVEKGDIIRPGASLVVVYDGPNDEGLIISMEVESDSSDVILLESQDEIFTDWVDWTPTFDAMGTVTLQGGQWRRVGSNMEIRAFWSSGTTTGGVVAMDLPSGYTIDSGKFNRLSDSTSASPVVGTAGQNAGAGRSFKVLVALTTSKSKLYFGGASTGSAIITPTTSIGNSASMSLFASVPISGWNTNFNPLLSMPLVELGADVGAYGGELGAPAYLYRQYVDLEETNTLGGSGLGTLTKGSSTSAFSFTASVDCIVSFSYSCGSSSSHDETGIISGPSSVPITDSTKSFVNTDYDGYRKSQGWIWAGDENPDNIATTFTMNAGDTMQLASTISGASYYTGASRTFSMVVQRIRQNTTMAHIIKPAVAFLKDKKAYNVAGGTPGSSTAWFARELNTFEGETWFLTPGTGTLGIGGNNTTFTLEPGTYKLQGTCPFYKTDYTGIRLYDVTNSVVVQYGTSPYFDSGVGVQGEAVVRATVTIGSSTEYRIENLTSTAYATVGLGGQLQNDSTGYSVFTQLTIEKLK